MKWKKRKDETAESWPNASERDATAALPDLTFAVEMLPDGQGITGLEAAIELLIALERDEEIDGLCRNFCSRFPYLSHAVYRILRKHECSIESTKLLHTVTSFIIH